MNDYTNVVFVALAADEPKLLDCIYQLGDDATILDVYRWTSPGSEDLIRVSTKLSTETATYVKLSNPFLSERMMASSISDDMKAMFMSLYGK